MLVGEAFAAAARAAAEAAGLTFGQVDPDRIARPDDLSPGRARPYPLDAADRRSLTPGANYLDLLRQVAGSPRVRALRAALV